ncbi:MAG: Gfo/Idh/MocA family protein [Egibacteraceae bacterium]
MSERGLRVGVIGAGAWGRIHLDVIRRRPDAVVAAVCDIDGDVAARAAEQSGGVPPYTDHEAMLDGEPLDAVTIVTPEHAHHAPTVAAARRGVHVLCEKPMAPTVADCEEMIAAAQASGVTLMVDFHNRWNPPYALLKERYATGKLGRAIYGHVKHSDSKVVPQKMVAWASATSILWFVGCHCVDLLRWVLDEEVVRVYGRVLSGTLRSGGVDADDAYLSMLEFEGGSVFMMENAWCLPDAEPHFLDPRLDLVGSEGSAYISVIKNQAMQVFTEDAGYETPDLLVAPEVHGRMRGYATESIDHFLDCVRDGVRPMVDGVDGLQATRVIRAILDSIEQDAPVTLA